MENGNSEFSPVHSPQDVPPDEEVQRVEAEPETGPEGAARPGSQASGGGGAREGAAFRFASFGSDGIRASSSGFTETNPPRLAAWICLVLAWLLLGSSVPFTVLLGVPLALAALLLGVVCLTRGSLFTGLVVLCLGSVGSLAVYLVGLFRFLTQW